MEGDKEGGEFHGSRIVVSVKSNLTAHFHKK